MNEKQRIINDLDEIKNKLEDLVMDCRGHLKGCSDGAVSIAYEAVCHAIDLANMAEMIKE
jgi:hypothetical protein